MWPYWILFLIPAVAAACSQPVQNLRADGTRPAKIDGPWALVLILLALMIGLRDRVGGDWFAYVRHLFHAETMTYAEAIFRPDPAYNILNIISLDLGLGILGVNLFCGFVFAFGLVLYARSMPRPWLALAVSIPYMTIVVSMGYSRQGVALGFALIGLIALGRQRFLWFAFWVFLAATFHRSAVVLISIPLLTINFRNYKNIPLLLIVVALMYVALIEGKTDQFVAQYIEAEMHSDGAFIRLLMNVVPATLLVLFRKRFSVSPGQRRIYMTMAFLAIVSFSLLVGGVLPSTALDRIALYLIPLQVFVFSNLPDCFGRYKSQKQAVVLSILFFYTLVLFVWLNYANFSHWWQPYRMFPPLDIEEAYYMRR
ncbi:EpsG family protein [Marinovum sp.]|uniref:EpsG family protein n=1 Tax=Marinovum sp. TaxID=2024839 RepID=UPI003A931014